MKTKVTYEDGEVVEYRVKPRHLLAFEEKFGKTADETVKAAYTLAHLASESDKPLKQWLLDVEDIQPIKEAGDTDAKAETDAEGEPSEPVPTE